MSILEEEIQDYLLKMLSGNYIGDIDSDTILECFAMYGIDRSISQVTEMDSHPIVLSILLPSSVDYNKIYPIFEKYLYRAGLEFHTHTHHNNVIFNVNLIGSIFIQILDYRTTYYGMELEAKTILKYRNE